MGMDWGAVAGGFSDGLQRNRQLRIQEQRDVRDTERHNFDMQERQRTADQRDRQESAYDELSQLIARRMQGGAAAPKPSAAAAAPPMAGDAIEQGNGVQTMPYKDTGAGLETRTLPADAAEAPGAGLTPLQAPAAAPQAAVAGPSDPGQKVGFGLYQNTHLLRDPEFLNDAAQIFIKNRMPEGVKWLERGFKAQQENAVDALKAFAGGNAERGIELFNASGRSKIERAEPITEGPDKGKWSVSIAGRPQPVLMDPGADLKSLLDPKSYFEVQNKERDDARAAAKDKDAAKLNEAHIRYYDAQGEAAKRNADSLSGYRDRMAGASETRANRSGGGNGSMSDKDYNNLSAKVSSKLRALLRDTAPTDPTGKKMTNPLAEFSADITESVMGDVRRGIDPDVAFNNRYAEWGDKLDKADQVLSDAFDKAKRAGSGLFNGRSDAVASLRDSIADLQRQGISIEEQRRFAQAGRKDMALFREAAQGIGGGKVANSPGLERTPRGGAADAGPKRPSTRAEVESYPSGTRFVNPADGRILVKK